ncbi:MAG: M28 family peptidase [Vicinamibacterales bacterium]
MFKSVFLAALLFLQAPTVAPAKFDSSRAWSDLRQVVAFGPRPAGSPAIEQTRQYIKSQLAAAKVAVREQAWDDTTPLGPVHMVNLIATIPGASKDRIIIAGHFDTKPYRQIRFVGANDGGSSTAFLLEMARVLATRKNPLTIELLFLDGEEATGEWQGTDHTYGSRHYVRAGMRDGSLATLKAFILVDMIADRDLKMRRDMNSTPWLTDIVWNAARAQKLGDYFSNERTEIEDDHQPFAEAGIPALDIIDLEYDAWHTPMDTLDNVSARSLQVVGDVLLAALPQIEQRLARK